MSSLSSIMDTSLSAMFSARVALGTVAHNIANASTPGYSRQEVLFGTRRPASFTYGSLGRGVAIQGIRRMTDQFLITNHRTQSSRLANYTQVDSALGEIESIMGSVDSDPLGDAINQFFGAWNDLANPSYNSSMKDAVVSAGRTLAATFRSLDSSLADLGSSLDADLMSEIDQLNGLLDQVGVLNQAIIGNEPGNTQANDMRDRRDILIGQISQLAKVSVLERDDGTVDLIMAGRTLVTRDQVQRLQGSFEGKDGGFELVLTTEKTHQPVELSEGRLAGLLAARKEHLSDAQQSLNDLAKLVIDRVNQLHAEGLSDGRSGLAFFSGDSALDIAVNSVLVGDPERVAISRSGVAGDRDVALEIANLAHAGLEGDDSASISETYRSLLTDLASRRSRFELLLENQDNLVHAVEARLESVRGVNLDEEGANMVRMQNAYDASARVVSVVQELFDTLLEMT